MLSFTTCNKKIKSMAMMINHLKTVSTDSWWHRKKQEDSRTKNEKPVLLFHSIRKRKTRNRRRLTQRRHPTVTYELDVPKLRDGLQTKTWGKKWDGTSEEAGDNGCYLPLLPTLWSRNTTHLAPSPSGVWYCCMHAAQIPQIWIIIFSIIIIFLLSYFHNLI